MQPTTFSHIIELDLDLQDIQRRSKNMLCFEDEIAYSKWHRDDIMKPAVKPQPEDSDEEVIEEEEED